MSTDKDTVALNESKEQVEDDYRESEDEDFNPDNVNGGIENDGEGDSSDDDEAGYQDEEDKSLASKYKDLEGVGLIKTRAQRKEEEEKAKEYAKSQEKSSIDVNALWNELNDSKPKQAVEPSVGAVTAPKSKSIENDVQNGSTSTSIQEEYITIKRSYKFAGNVTTEEKKVLASSAEGKAYLAEQNQLEKDATVPKSKTKGPKKRKSTLMDELEAGKAKRMNTLEKSRLDWLGFVDQEGIRDDLSRHNKGGYLHKQDFLSRVEHKIDQDIKAALKKK
ncbi:Swc5p [Sugiyamaella lignohabitans]|uniref:SWR1-complex protein 5 n=1 Tax=Sugiyamaella lignohabitans TaxID=796027 RepID=A0A167FDQ6_9ASCO|nr:Swc5p [Sugiyamaella lignohabitans]ANB15169.1 Swc5p [Sugiyamaella lignohabitans]